MAKKLFYVVKPQLEDVGDDILEANGWKTITAYTIEKDNLEQFFEVECSRSDNSVEAIKGYLNDNGYGDDTIQMIEI